eukprot:4621755-Alexandrium_andersonii.AAC.1
MQVKNCNHRERSIYNNVRNATSLESRAHAARPSALPGKPKHIQNWPANRPHVLHYDEYRIAGSRHRTSSQNTCNVNLLSTTCQPSARPCCLAGQLAGQ